MLWTQRSVFILYTYVAIAVMSFAAGQQNNSSGNLSDEVNCTTRYCTIVFEAFISLRHSVEVRIKRLITYHRP